MSNVASGIRSEPLSRTGCNAGGGHQGNEEKLRCRPPRLVMSYEDAQASGISQKPARRNKTLRESDILRERMGDDVVDHYTRAAEWEQEEFDRVVTDWEIARGFERA